MAFEAKDKDWAKIEADYRAGIKSNVSIGNEHGVSETAIRKRAKKESWVKDLKAQIKAKADSLVRAQLVRDTVRIDNAISEKEIIEVNAQMQATIIFEHRTDIQRNRSLAKKLLNELEFVTDNKELFEQLGELLIDTSPNENGKVNQDEAKRLQALNRAIDLSGRVSSAKALSETLKVLIALEREAFGIDQKSNTGKSLEDFLERLDGGN